MWQANIFIVEVRMGKCIKDLSEIPAFWSMGPAKRGTMYFDIISLDH